MAVYFNGFDIILAPHLCDDAIKLSAANGFAVIIRQKLPQCAVFYRLIQPYHGAEIGIGIKPETGAMFGIFVALQTGIPPPPPGITSLSAAAMSGESPGAEAEHFRLALTSGRFGIGRVAQPKRCQRLWSTPRAAIDLGNPGHRPWTVRKSALLAGSFCRRHSSGSRWWRSCWL